MEKPEIVKPEDIWGERFKTKYRDLVSKSYRDRTEITLSMRQEIIGLVKSAFDGERVSLTYPRNNTEYNVILVQAPRSILPRQFSSGDYNIGMMWKGSWVSAIVSEKFKAMIEPDKFYILVGFLKLKGQYQNFYVRDIITLEEVAKNELAKHESKKVVDKPKSEDLVITREVI